MIDFITSPGVWLVAGLIAFYLITYTLNKKTPIPEECIEDLKKASCGGCKNFACSHKH